MLKALDFIVPVHPRHNYTAARVLCGLERCMPLDNIWLVTQESNFDFFKNLQRKHLDRAIPLEILNEDKIIENITRESVQEYFTKNGFSPDRAGWYFQQFLKMGFFLKYGIKSHYVTWDADTIPLRPFDFFDDRGRILIQPTSEHHAPYFKTMDRLLGLRRLAFYSFISGHLIIESEVMRSLISDIKNRHPSYTSWVLAILDCVSKEDLQRSGFSEYETHGNYLLSQKPESIVARKLASTRKGTFRYGIFPSEVDLWNLSVDYYFVTFETWHPFDPRNVAQQQMKALQVLLIFCCLFRSLATLEELRSSE